MVLLTGAVCAAQGVMLSHSNLFYQVDKFDFFVRLGPSDQTLSLLPPWHIYERAVGYYIFSCGCKQVLRSGGHRQPQVLQPPGAMHELISQPFCTSHQSNFFSSTHHWY